MAANEQAMWQKLLSTMASIESHLAQAKQARAQGDVDKAAGKSQEANYQAKQYDKLVEALKTVNEEAQTYQEAGERALAILRDQLAIQKDLDKLGVTTAAALVENIQKQIKAQEQLNKNQEKSDKVIKSIFKTTLGITDLKMEDTGLGTLLNPAVWSNIGKSVKETFTLSKIAAASWAKMAQSTMAAVLALDNAQAGFHRTTGLGAEFNDMLVENTEQLRQFGLGYAEAAGGIAALQASMSNFVLLSREAQASMSVQVAANEQLGIASATTSGNFALMTQAMGMTAAEAQTLTDDLSELAINLGRAPAQIAEDFSQAAPQLAQFGSRAIEVFEGLEIQAAATGIALQTLLGVAERMDTFEGAADAASRLNVVLGGGGGLINSIDLMMAEPQEKMRMIQEAFQRTGQSFSDLDRHTQRYMTEALGLSNVAEATRLLSGSTMEQAQALEQLTSQQQELDEQRRQSASIQQKLTQLALSFGVAVLPIVELLHSFLDPIAEFISQYPNFFKVITGLIIGFWAFKKILSLSSVALFGLPPALGATAAASGPAAAGITAVSTATGALATALGGVALAMLGIGLGVGLIGLGIGVAAWGLSHLVESFVSLGEVLNWEMIGMMTAFLAVLGIAGSFAVPIAIGLGLIAGGMAAIGLAMMLVPKDTLIAFTGTMESMKGTVEAVAEAPESASQIVEIVESTSELMDKPAVMMMSVLAGTAATLASVLAPLTALAGGGEGAGQDIVLVLNEREFARAVNTRVENGLKVITQ